MDCLSKIFGTENLWMVILRVPINIDRMQDRPKPKPNRTEPMPNRSESGPNPNRTEIIWIPSVLTWAPKTIEKRVSVNGSVKRFALFLLAQRVGLRKFCWNGPRVAQILLFCAFFAGRFKSVLPLNGILAQILLKWASLCAKFAGMDRFCANFA